MNRRSLSAVALIAALLLSYAPAALAQGSASRVTGIVQDAGGAVVEGATVTLTNEGTNVPLTTQTTSTGNYVFDSVQVGSYSVTVEKQGFKKFVSTGNAVNINQPATVNAVLEAGNINESVTVQGSAELVQTSVS